MGVKYGVKPHIASFVAGLHHLVCGCARVTGVNVSIELSMAGNRSFIILPRPH